MLITPESSTLLHTVLDGAQAGALLALAANFGADAITRRDRLTSWLTLACFFISARHGILAVWGMGQLAYPVALKLQSSMASLGFIALFVALRRLFPDRLSPLLLPWVVVGLLPNFIRNALLNSDSPFDLPLHQVVNLTYALASLYTVMVIGRAKVEGDPMGRRMFWGLLTTLALILLEVGAMALFDVPLRISGLAVVMLAIAMGGSWQWLISSSQERRARSAEEEAKVWRSLVSGPSWRTGESAPLMEGLFGSQWQEQLATRMVGRDGALYAIHHADLPSSAGKCGWIETHLDTLPGTEGMLAGWIVALSLADEEALNSIARCLRDWGADVRVWGPVPPKEGPYPSLLIWGREPMTMAVWREGDLARRLPRWVQLGGAPMEGPHARLDLPVDRTALQGVLHRLISIEA